MLTHTTLSDLFSHVLEIERAVDGSGDFTAGVAVISRVCVGINTVRYYLNGFKGAEFRGQASGRHFD